MLSESSGFYSMFLNRIEKDEFQTIFFIFKVHVDKNTHWKLCFIV